MENETQTLVNELFNMISAEDITQHMAETFSAFIENDIDNGVNEIKGKYFGEMVYLNATLINFFHKLNKANYKNKLVKTA